MNATIPMLLVSTVAVGVVATAQTANPPKIGKRVPVDVSVEGLGQASRRAPGDSTRGGSIGLSTRRTTESLTPFDCIRRIADQADPGGCLMASSTPTLGMLYPYPGRNNVVVPQAFVGGGVQNQALRRGSTVGGGFGNTASGFGATVAGGGLYYNGYFGNTASGNRSTVGGGIGNTASRYNSTVGGGLANSASCSYATVGGGGGTSIYAFSVGNTATGKWATVGGGADNTASGRAATVAGGGTWRPIPNGGIRYLGNTASGDYSTVGGGHSNTADGDSATIAGGRSNTAAGDHSFAAGRLAKADHDGAFVWGDSQSMDKTSSVADQFNVYASDRDAKENVEPVNSRAVLGKVSQLPLSTWNYKDQDDSVRHMGPMAQDFYAAFGLGLGEKTIDTIDPNGVALAAIQGLNDLVNEKDAEIAANEKRIEQLEVQLSELASRLNEPVASR